MTTITDTEIEQEIQAKGLTAPRVTLEDIEGAIVYENYYIVSQAPQSRHDYPDALDRLSFYILVMRNGYTVVGHSACVSHDNFDADLGRKISRQHAIDQCWALFGFSLADQLFNERQVEIRATAFFKANPPTQQVPDAQE
jgi:hypothetical protein